MKDKKDHISQQIKLEEIPKTQNFSVPEGYFDKLPTVIQARVGKPAKQAVPVFSWSIAWQVGLPVLALVLMIAYFGARLNNGQIDVQAMIDEVPTEELISYLAESDMTTDELLSLIDVNELDVDGMLDEEINLLNDEDLDSILEDFPEFTDEI